MSSRNTLIGPDGKVYALRLDREQLAEICRHFHWIPVMRGDTGRFVSRTFPGWDSNTFAKVFRENRIVTSGSPPAVRADVAEVWIASSLECLVVRSRKKRAVSPAAPDVADPPGH